MKKVLGAIKSESESSEKGKESAVEVESCKEESSIGEKESSTEEERISQEECSESSKEKREVPSEKWKKQGWMEKSAGTIDDGAVIRSSQRL